MADYCCLAAERVESLEAEVIDLRERLRARCDGDAIVIRHVHGSCVAGIYRKLGNGLVQCDECFGAGWAVRA